MKRIILSSVLLTVITLLAVACSKDDAGQTNTPDSTTPESNTDAKTGVSFGKTLVSMVFTVVAMLLILFLAILLLSLFQQVYVFGYSIYTEIAYRIRG